MQYGKVIPGVFRQRPNRFIAYVDTAEGMQICHVKNTGRCKELLIDGAVVYLEESFNLNRKTKFDLIAVEKGELLINMDSQAPNRTAAEYLPTLFPNLSLLRPETRFGGSRFDFYVETPDERWFVEVKGVTLEREGIALFPDAPTARGAKHLRELCACMDKGYKACILFVIQMEGVCLFTLNAATDPEFAQALAEASRKGVRIEAVNCLVTPGSMQIHRKIEVNLSN